MRKSKVSHCHIQDFGGALILPKGESFNHHNKVTNGHDEMMPVIPSHPWELLSTHSPVMDVFLWVHRV